MIKLTPRNYQSAIFETAKSNNTLVVLPTGLGKCLQFSQPILLNDGSLIKIGEYFEEEAKNNKQIKHSKNHFIIKPMLQKKAISLNSTLKLEDRKIIAIHKKRASKKLLKITTDAGAELITTPEHPLLTLNNKLEWKRADKFKIQEPIASPSKLPEPKSKQKIDLFKIFSKINPNTNCYVEINNFLNKKYKLTKIIKLQNLLKTNINKEELAKNIKHFYISGSRSNKAKIKPVWEASEELFYWIGLIIAEGSVHGGIKFYNNNKKILNDFNKFSKKLFGLTPKNIKGGLILSSTALFYFVKNLFDLKTRQHSREKNISQLIMCAPNKFTKSLISALYDGEGSVRKDGLIEIVTASKELANKLCYLLLRFGIKGRLKEKIAQATNSPSPKKRVYYRIYIEGKKDLEIFQNYIGFKHEEKKRKLKRYLSKKISYNPNFNLIPIEGNEIRKIRNALNLSSSKWKDFEIPGIDTYERNERRFSHESLKKTIKGFEKKSIKNKKIIDKINFLKKLVESNIYWDRIKKIEKCKEKWVYDISLDKDFNFIAGSNGGIIAHNTLIALLLTIHRQKSHPGTKTLILAPTRPLVEQHFNSFKSQLPELFAQIELFTGTVPAKNRRSLFDKADIIFSTPQCISNDLQHNLYNLIDTSLLIIDEAHRCLKNYSYTKVVEFYKNQAPIQQQKILGLTASPGSDSSKIKEICNHLAIEEIEIRSRDSPDVKPYLKEREFQKIEVPFPIEFIEIKVLLQKIFDNSVNKLRAKNLLFGPANKISLLQLQNKLAARIPLKDFTAMQGMSLTAQAIKVSHAIELLETQTLSGLNEYLKSLQTQAAKKQSRAVQNLIKDPNFSATLISLQTLLKNKIEHPKVEELAVITESEINMNPNAKLMIFSQFRETASTLSNRLNKINGIRSQVFLGQTKKSNSKGVTSGLSQKEQKAVIEKFKVGEINVICATSIGEEGLDIPEVSAVIFYEPIPSAIRKIQRAGRTARLSPGKLLILITKDTRDVAYHYASAAREKKMYSTLEKVKVDLKNPKKTLQDF